MKAIDEDQSHDKDKEDKNQSPAAIGKKRKRGVTFGEPTGKTDKLISANDQLAELRAELEQAERMERKAQELRQKLFGSRVCSRTDVADLGTNVKSLKRIFPCGGAMAAVVDDREDVWANAEDMKSTRPGEPPENLLLVRPYHWSSFAGFADVNNAAGADLTSPDSEPESETDAQLLATGDILKRLHLRYYSGDSSELGSTTVPGILERMRSEVLSGCQLVLSGLVLLTRATAATTTKYRDSTASFCAVCRKSRSPVAIHREQEHDAPCG